MYKLTKSDFVLKFLKLHLVLLLVTIKSAECKRLSFKDSLTAYAEDKLSTAEVSTDNVSSKEWKNAARQVSSLSTSLKFEGNKFVGRDGSQEPKASPNSEAHAETNQFPVWEVPKAFPLSFRENIQKPKPSIVRGDYVKSETSSTFPLFGAKNKPPTGSNLVINDTSLTKSETLEDANQPRNKKAISSNPGLRELMWNTATALWSVNKEHFLPTFLHTKTGGKLSLGRDSIFKPVNILSQFKTGVREINNEKTKNLARLSTAGHGWGWSKPSSHWATPQNSRFLTLVKYIFRLSRHTAVTKFKLKRALLDLQIEAAKKLYRILTSKTVAQKLAVMRILRQAAWKGKLALLRAITETSTTPAYPGTDHAVYVDITYPSSDKHKHPAWASYTPPPPPLTYTAPANKYRKPEWTSYTPPPKDYSPPPPPPSYSAPLNTYYAGYKPSVSATHGLPPEPSKYNSQKWKSYVPPAKDSPAPLSYSVPLTSYNAPPVSDTYSAPPDPNKYNNPDLTSYLPPAKDSPPMSYSAPLSTYYAGYNPSISATHGLPPEPGAEFAAPPPPSQAPYPSLTTSFARSSTQDPSASPKPLIEQPSYASVLKSMGINPSGYSEQDNHIKSLSTLTSGTTLGSTSSSSSEITPPKPTVVYYSSSLPVEDSSYNQVNIGSTGNAHTIETPTLSYSIHTSTSITPPPLPPSSTIVKLASSPSQNHESKVTAPYEVTGTTPPTSFGLKLLKAMTAAVAAGR